MKQLTVKALLAIAAMAASGAASAYQVWLIEDGFRAGNSPTSAGTRYSMFFDGSDGNTASTATWDWDGVTLTQTGGTLQAYARIGSTTSGTAYLGDIVTGLVIDTGTAITTATSYNCVEGAFGATIGASVCGNYGLGVNLVNESTIAYNIGGVATCSRVTVLGDDTWSGSPATAPFRGLESADPTGCAGANAANQNQNNTDRGAYDDINIFSDTTGTGGSLTLNNWNGALSAAAQATCMTTASGGAVFSGGVTSCNRTHWMTFSAVPVPAAVWLFGSAIGLLGVARRRVA